MRPLTTAATTEEFEYNQVLEALNKITFLTARNVERRASHDHLRLGQSILSLRMSSIPWMAVMQTIPADLIILGSTAIQAPISNFHYYPGVIPDESMCRTRAALVYKTLELHLYLNFDDLLALSDQVLERCTHLLGLACYLTSHAFASRWCLLAFWTLVSQS